MITMIMNDVVPQGYQFTTRPKWLHFDGHQWELSVGDGSMRLKVTFEGWDLPFSYLAEAVKWMDEVTKEYTRVICAEEMLWREYQVQRTFSPIHPVLERTYYMRIQFTFLQPETDL